MGKSVGKFNLEVVENKWARWGVFVLLGPVYGFAGAIDLLVLHSIEFYSGENPWSGEARLTRAGDTFHQEGSNGETVVSTLIPDGSIELAIIETSATTQSLNVTLEDGEYIARDSAGHEGARGRDPRSPIGLSFLCPSGRRPRLRRWRCFRAWLLAGGAC
jgi:hypothetical protein